MSGAARPIVLAMTGASGAVVAVRLLQRLAAAGREVYLLVSPSGWAVIGQELGGHFRAAMPEGDRLVGMLAGYTPGGRFAIEDSRWGEPPGVGAGQVRHYGYGDYFSPVASGSSRTAGMIICPCSGATLSGVSRASGENLIQRAADVHLKERRPLLLMPRETPLSSFQLENMLRCSQAGATVMPMMPGWYHDARDTLDLVDFLVARALDHFGVEHDLMRRWAE